MHLKLKKRHRNELSAPKTAKISKKTDRISENLLNQHLSKIKIYKNIKIFKYIKLKFENKKVGGYLSGFKERAITFVFINIPLKVQFTYNKGKNSL